MSRLIEGLWIEHESDLFGLSKDQMRMDDFVHNGRWYNLTGEFIGYGDLSVRDLLTISRGLEGDEVFVVLNENDGYNHQRVAHNEAIKAGQSLDSVVINGIAYRDYVAAKCRYVVVAGMAFDVREGRTQDVSPEMRQHKSGLIMVNVSREFIIELFCDARKLLAA